MPKPLEAALEQEIVELGEWLAAQGIDVRKDHSSIDEGSRDRLYWRYGYLIGLKHAHAILTTRALTLL